MSEARRFVVGDLHGCAAELERLLDGLAPGVGDTLCFLGDYIDRGPASKAVIDRLIALAGQGPRCVFLKGNHEDMFLAFLGLPGHYGEAFVGNGGAATLASYGLGGFDGGAIAARLPPDHLAFLRGLQTSAQLGRFLCVHAGIRPTVPLDRQDDEDLLWIRAEFVDRPHPFPLTVVYGHTPQADVRLDLPYKIGLDTGCVYGNRLSCLELSSARLIQIERGDHVLRERSLAPEFAAAGLIPA